MKAMLALEWRGWGGARGLTRRPGIAGIIAAEKHRSGHDAPRVTDLATGADVLPITDYRGATRSFLRGVLLRFILESGQTYEVHAHTSWRGRERYRCTVTNNGEIVRL